MAASTSPSDRTSRSIRRPRRAGARPSSTSSGPASALKPFLGTPFGVAFLAAQLGYVFFFHIKRGWIWILAFCILRIPFFFLTSNTALWRNPQALSGLDELITGAACISGFLLGLGVLARRL